MNLALRKSLIIWIIPIAIFLLILAIYFFRRESVVPQVVPQYDCNTAMERIAPQYPEIFDDLQHAVEWCQVCLDNNSVPYLSQTIGAFCNPKTSDVGTACLDSDECAGVCVTKSLDSKAGTCSEFVFLGGCLYEMADGQAVEYCRN